MTLPAPLQASHLWRNSEGYVRQKWSANVTPSASWVLVRSFEYVGGGEGKGRGRSAVCVRVGSGALLLRRSQGAHSRVRRNAHAAINGTGTQQ